MRVDAPLSFPEDLQPQQKVARTGSSSQPNRSAPADSGQDQAQLSADSVTIQQLKSQLARVPEVRPERVEALRQAVSSGSYQVSDQQLGNAIASDMLGQVIG